MPSQFLAILLIILAWLPNFGHKADFENKIATSLLGTPSPQQFSTNGLVAKIPVKIDPLTKASILAEAAYFLDYESGEVLLAKNETKRLPVASTTKLMTAIVAQEQLDPKKIVTVKTLQNLPLDAVMGLAIGDKIKASELMHGLLIASGSDAATTIALATSGTVPKFVAEMNHKAAYFGLKDTEFSNPIGHDGPNNKSTAKDIASLARLAISNKTIKAIVSKKSYVAKSETGKSYYLTNTNSLLADPNYTGVKTGTTYDAGECLVILYNDGQRKILGVVLNSPNRFAETRQIIEWTKQAFLW